MTRPSNEARLQLRDARDALCVSQLFANHPFTADDATDEMPTWTLHLSAFSSKMARMPV
jgi:hypothetical protein